MKKIKIQVITKIPDVDYDDGNLCNDLLVANIDKDNGTNCFRPFNDTKSLTNKGPKILIQQEVFSLGEIIIVGDDGREIGGKERKVSKWYVGYEVFDLEEIEKAVELSNNLGK